MTKHKKIIIAISLLLLLMAGIAGYSIKKSHQFDNVVTTSKSPSAQANYNAGKNRTSNSDGGAAQGGAVDTNGTNVPTNVAGTSSQSGAITVKQPAQNEKISSGSVITGTTQNVEAVQYRIIDNNVGVIGQGTLKVVNGSFSGTLQFKSYADSGRLDIFSYGELGEEINVIEVPVTF